MSTGPHAVVLAAGAGKRFLQSGGTIYKQLTPIDGVPVILRLVQQLDATGRFSGVTVVLGDDPDCGAAVRAALQGCDLRFVVNSKSSQDNNLLSMQAGVQGIETSILLIEADCVVAQQDLVAMIDGLEGEEIRWADIGAIEGFDYGGLIEVDPVTGAGISVDVLAAPEFAQFKADGRNGVKMFGLSAFGAKALSVYKGLIEELQDPYQKYFHYIATQNPRAFKFTTCRVSEDSFSFNTVSELLQEND